MQRHQLRGRWIIAMPLIRGWRAGRRGGRMLGHNGIEPFSGLPRRAGVAAARRSGSQQGVERLGVAWTCSAGWGRVEPQGCPGAKASGRTAGNSSQPACAGVGWCRSWAAKTEIPEYTLTRRAIVALGASYEVDISENTGRTRYEMKASTEPPANFNIEWANP
jgi:hypothetical protein